MTTISFHYHDILGFWKENVRAIVVADDYAQNQLWKEFSKESAELFGGKPLDLRVTWEQGNPGYIHTIKGEHFDTSVSLFVHRINGILVLFWDCTSMKCDWEAAEKWVRATFTNSVDSSDATNFANVLHTLRRL